MRTLIPHTPAEARTSHLESPFWRRLLLCGLRYVPAPVQEATMPLWSFFFYAQVPHVRRAIEHNLRQLYEQGPLAAPPGPEKASPDGVCGPATTRERGRTTDLQLQRMAFRTFTNYCRCIATAYSLHAGIARKLSAHVVGLEELHAALARGQGAILATGHIGNWHIGPYLLAQHGLPPITVVMNEEPDPGAQQIEAAMRDTRMRIIYPERNPLLSLELRAALRRGELIGLQIDRPTTGGSIWVPYGARKAAFAPGPAMLARLCRVPVVPVFFPLTKRGIRIQILPPLWAASTAQPRQDIFQLTCRLAETYWQQLQRFPDQWFNFFHFWRENEEA